MSNNKKIVMVIGSGGREHAIAKAMAASSRVARVFVCPGNAGTRGEEDDDKTANVELHENSYVATARLVKADLVFVGPEAPLVEGVSDALAEAGIKCFGPSKAASILESSKAWSKDFFQRHNLPTARYRTFNKYEEAKRYVESIDFPVVVKASGLAAGKGVLIPRDRAETIAALETVMVERAFGEAGDEVVVEEFLSGEEVSVLAFCDGKTSRCMPPAQDHKRALDGDQGLNTGGMGAYAPAPCVTPKLRAEIDDIVQRTLTAMSKENIPFVGVLFAGLMLTPRSGPMLLEYNVRMGDPETEVVLPLLRSDLFEICEACVEGRLADLDITWKDATSSAITVVLAAKGYPETYPKGIPISGLERVAEEDGPRGVTVYHAGTTREEKTGRVVSNGGRVLAVTGVAGSLSEAARIAYAAADKIHFEPPEMKHHRRDIGFRVLNASSPNVTAKEGSSSSPTKKTKKSHEEA